MSDYITSKLAPGVIMDALFAEWDADRGAPSAEVAEWADRELDRAFAEQSAHAEALRDHVAGTGHGCVDRS